jgi:RimJ/RimL family protein N-acetyltransferase
MSTERIVSRPMRPDDVELLRRFHERLSARSLYLRFFTPVPRFDSRAAARLARVDHDHEEALVAIEDGEIVGVARWHRQTDDPTHAEVAVIVADDWQGHGIGRYLLTNLARLARRQGIDEFTGTVLGENTAMLGLARSLSPQATFERHWPDIEMHIPLRRAA